MGGEKLSRIQVFFITLIMAGGIVLGVYADESPGETAAPEPEPGGIVSASPENSIIIGEAAPDAALIEGPSVSVVVRMVLVLALAAASVYGLVFLVRRVSRPREPDNPHIKVLGSVYLGSNRFVYIIAVHSRAWLVGAGEGGISLISEIDDQEAVDAMLLDDSVKNSETGGPGFSNFRALLRRIGGGIFPGPGGGSPGASGGNGRLSPDNLRKQRDRLKGL